MKKTTPCSLLKYIKTKAEIDYQVVPPHGAFEYLLLNNRAFVIFDGLDELLDTSYRHEISGDIEAFCHLYPSIPVLITSREVGYEQAPLDPERFETFQIAPFDANQVREYVKKWFGALPDLPGEQGQQKAAAFLNESRMVPDLRDNPLMLALLCNIFRGENYIPKNRPDVYKKCATMLFERWDKNRGIHVLLPFDAHIRPAMMYLAYWMYTDEGLRSGVSEARLIEKTQEYLRQKLYADPDEAEKAAREFIDFCRGRAWVFSDVGTTGEGTVLYHFTHQTFLEYFAASYFCRTHPTAPALLEALQPKIAKREWDVVAQLAFQIQNEQVEDAGDALLGTLTAQSRGNEDAEGWSMLSFAVRCRQFIIPSPTVTQAITAATLERTLKWGLEHIDARKAPGDPGPDTYYRGHKPGDILTALMEALPDNRRTILPGLERLLTETIQHGSEPEALLATEVALYLEYFLTLGENARGEEGGDHERPRNTVHDLWPEAVHRISRSCSRIASLCEKHVQLCLPLLVEGELHAAEVLRWHGMRGLLKEYSCIIFPNTTWTPITSQLVLKAAERRRSPDEATAERYLAVLRDLGASLLAYPHPWFEEQQWDADVSPLGAFPLALVEWSQGSEERGGSHLDADALFGIFALVALLVEINKSPRFARSCTWSSLMDSTQDLLKVISLSYHPLFTSMHALFLARYDSTMASKAAEETERCGFTTLQREFLWRWIRTEENLVGAVTPPAGSGTPNSEGDVGEKQHAGRVKTVLIVDDSPEFVSLLSWAIKDDFPGIAISFAYDGETALKQIAQHPPSLLALDYLMPVMDGFRVLQELDRQGAKFPIIFCSAYLSAEEVFAFARTSQLLIRFVPKPFQLDTFIDVAQELLSEKQEGGTPSTTG